LSIDKPAIRRLHNHYAQLGKVIVAQDNGLQQPSAREQLQRIHTPQAIDQELARLTKDLS